MMHGRISIVEVFTCSKDRCLAVKPIIMDIYVQTIYIRLEDIKIPHKANFIPLRG